VTEFVFAAASTVTIPVTQQPNLDALIEPQDFAQSFQVDYALCREFDGKDRLQIQRAISK
jgi:transposase